MNSDVKPVLVFKTATVPDVAGIRLLHALPATLADNEVVEFVYQKSRAQADVSNAPDVLPLHLHRVVSIACALHDGQQFRLLSLAQADNTEAALIQRFCDLIARENAQLVSWKGGRFDVPVLQYRGLANGMSDQAFVALTGSAKTGFEEMLASSSGIQASLHELAGLCGFPHGHHLPGNQIWHAWRTGRTDEIHARCEMDAVICHLVFLRCQLLRGGLSAEQYANELRMVRAVLAVRDAQPWREFLADWAL